MITVKGGGGVLNNPPIVSELKVVREPTQTSISISYRVTDAELQITRHYLTVSGVYNKKEITKEVGYEMPDNLFTYTITGLTKGTEYTIQIMCNDGHGQGNSNPLQVSTKSAILYSFTINENDSNPRTRVAYGDDAVGVTPATSNSLGDWENKWPFNVIRIVGLRKEGTIANEIDKNNKRQYIDGTPIPNVANTQADIDVFTEFPTIYWRKSAPDGQIKVEISDSPLVGGDCYAHKVGGVIRPNIYVGCYLGLRGPVGRLRSLTGQSPTASLTLSNFRNAAHTRGSGYELLNFNILTMLQNLWTLAYRNTNSQLALGKGLTEGSRTAITGGTDTKGWVYGSQNGNEQMCFLGIEDLWGNLWQWVDGLFLDSAQNILVNFKNTNFDSSGSGYENTGTQAVVTAGYMKSVNTLEKSGFFPSASKASATTYYADYCEVGKNNIATCGGYWNDYQNAGIYFLGVHHGVNEATQYIGARLVYIGEVV